jgi:hypothetical protein
VLRALREATQKAELKGAEETLRQNDAYLAEAQREPHWQLRLEHFQWRNLLVE